MQGMQAYPGVVGACPRFASRRAPRRHALRCSASTAVAPVVLLPGLGNSDGDYVELSAALSLSLGGAVVRTARVARPDWLRNAAGVVDPSYWRGTLNPRPTVDWYLQRISDAVAEAQQESGQQRVSLLAHSAGGWLARVWMQQHGLDSVACVLSLGSPLRPPPVDVPGVIDQTRGILTYVDSNCPGPAELRAAGGRFVCVAGRYLRGSESLSELNAWVVGQGYRQVCGQADVWGDGITPTEWALLPGAEQLTLEGVFHSPVGAGPGRLWYGSKGVLEQWVDKLRAPELSQLSL